MRRWSKWAVARKSVLLLLIAGMMTAGLMAFHRNRMVLMHQQPYYAALYLQIARYKAGSLLGKYFDRPVQASSRPGHAVSVPVLVYHGVRPKPEGENIDVTNFAEQLIALKRDGWQTVSIQDYYDFMRHGKQLPLKSFVITFDDARKDSYYPVDPLLAALNFHATMFVITKSSFDPIENKFYLDKAELLRMRDSGRWDLQPHAAYGHYLYPVDAKGTLGHFYDNKLWLSDAKRLETGQEVSERTLGDLELAKREMKQEVGSSGIAFAFPFNEFGAGSLNFPGAQAALTNNAGKVFPIAFYQIWPNKGNSQNYPQDPSFLMKRILIESDLNASKLLKILHTSGAKPLPYTNDMTRKTSDWLSTWGDEHWGPGGLTIDASPDGTGAAMFVDGGGAWRDYLVNARLHLERGQWARVLGRFRDDRNYVSCSYSSRGVLMEETVDGVTHELEDIDMPVPTGDFRAELGVNGSRVECKIDGKIVTYDDGLTPVLGYGSAGFSSYDPAKHNSQVRISDMRVEPLE
ncbi:MAG: Polysaccharide deacetylase [Patescibacteria group bacterium]|nr:Polysaccharide deacetylase [Patescibacteria group bacterium]